VSASRDREGLSQLLADVLDVAEDDTSTPLGGGAPDAPGRDGTLGGASGDDREPGGLERELRERRETAVRGFLARLPRERRFRFLRRWLGRGD